MRRALAAVLACAPLVAPVAHAEAPPQATALFDQGIKDMRAGNTELACKELAASLAAYPDSGTKGALAECYTKLGKLASAWSLWRDLADTAPSRELRADAAARAKKLEPRMPKFQLRLAAPLAAQEVVTVAGHRVVDPTLPVALPLDPGPFTVAASAPGYATWTATFQAQEGDTTTVAIPALARPGEGAGNAPGAGAAPPTRPRDAALRSSHRIAAGAASAHVRDDVARPAPAPHRPLTQRALWLDVGPAEAHRSLTYGKGGIPLEPAPPDLTTDAVSAVIQAEVYPFAFGDARGPAAGLGLAASFGATLGLSLPVPGAGMTAPVDEGQLALGVRYRFALGASTVALGLDYWARHETADRSHIPPGTKLDVPDVSYQAIAPGVIARIGIAPRIGLLAALEVPLMISSGPITEADDYGAAHVVAIAGRIGVDVALAPHDALRVMLSADDVSLSFHDTAGGMAQLRGVTGANDTMIGATAMFAVAY